MSFRFPKNVRFKCNKCALCCGDTEEKVRAILMMKIEVERISQKTSKAIDDFAENIADSEPYAYRMKKSASGKCVFLKHNMCTIYETRPLICRFYPFELRQAEDDSHFFSCTDECPCIGKGPLLKRSYFEELFEQSKRTIKENRRSQSKQP